MEMRPLSLDFSQPVSGSGPRTSSQTVVFSRQVLRAVAGLSGYFAEYSGGDGHDHHLGQLTVQVSTAINSNTVTVTGAFGLRDWSGNWDDEYDGNIECVVLADLENPSQQPPRTDLLITGVEVNQAVQYFRSSTYLDPAHVMPDNAIWPVARKNTGLRVYVDYDPDGTLPPIANLTGNLIIQNGATTLTLSPINPGGAITPRRDSAINMAVADQTLNFMIPASLCTGTVEMTCTVWDQADASKRPSPLFMRTLAFTPVEPLSIFLVGVGYTAVAPNLPAPTQAAVSASLSQLIKTYPIGDLIETGYTTLSFSETVTGNLAKGCGKGLNDLLSRLSDLRGSSPDIYLGSLPAGVVGTPGNSIGGCAPQPGRQAAVFVDLPGDVPHEIGHDLGRGHAPCNPGVCTPPPANVDGSYPQYGTFPAGSIGVFGFDATTDSVLDPSSTFDFMAYRFPQWVSAYTYNGLRGASFGPTPGAGGSGAMAHLIGGIPIDTLFLGLTITRDRQVALRPSFHFPAPLFGAAGCTAQFSVEFQDNEHNPIGCAPLVPDCSAGCECWPKTFLNDVGFPEGARQLVIYEDDRKLHEEPIPDPPTLRVVGSEEQEDGVVLQWAPEGPPDEHGGPLWYLVHWLDGDDWRGVAPRQQEASILIPRRLFIDSPTLRVRVLATSGIATGITEATLHLDSYQPSEPEVGIREALPEDQLPAPLPNVIHAIVRDSGGRQILADSMAWFADDGQLIGRGQSADLRALSPGEHEVRIVARRLGGQGLMRAWRIERTAQGFALKQVLPPTEITEVVQHPHPHPPPGT
jgi:hypothetical protein